jgi:acyl-CoA reductase-like NAD-dependent aldehyde dehydrogenase
MYNTGQSCCSVERIYVHEAIYKSFLDHFVESVKGLKVGPPLDETTYIGPLVQEKQLTFLADQVKDAVNKGLLFLFVCLLFNMAHAWCTVIVS